MFRQPGFIGGLLGGDSRGPDPDPTADVDVAGGLDGKPPIRLGEPDQQSPDAGFGVPSGFDPVWGSLGPQPVGEGGWNREYEAQADGVTVGVEVLGDGFGISGELRIGQFDRLSDWLNMRSGFIQISDARQLHFGRKSARGPDQPPGTLWVRLEQIVLVAERSPVRRERPGAPTVAKQQRQVAIVTPGYTVRGSVHVHADGSMTHFLESPDPHFLPMTDLTVHWLSDASAIARFPFAMVNRHQLVTVMDESTLEAGKTAEPEDRRRKAASG